MNIHSALEIVLALARATHDQEEDDNEKHVQSEALVMVAEHTEHMFRMTRNPDAE